MTETEQDNLIALFSADEDRKLWAEQKAESRYAEIKLSLSDELQREDRVGPIVVDELGGQLCLWVNPLARNKLKGILLGPENSVQLFCERGEVLFQGLWKNLPAALLKERVELYLWIAPPIRPNQSQPGGWKVQTQGPMKWLQRVRGWLKNR